MGNGFAKLTVCFTGNGESRNASSFLISDPSLLDEGLGHSFCYIRPDPTRISSSKVHSSDDDFSTTFRSISGAAVSANTSTPLSTSFVDPYATTTAAAFESSTSFALLPLQPIPKIYSDPGQVPGSGPLERGFLSGPIERGFMSGPLDRGIFSGPMEINDSNRFKRSFSHGFRLKSGSGKKSVIRVLQRVVSKTISRGHSSIVAPIKSVVVKEPTLWVLEKNLNKNLSQSYNNENLTISSVNFSSEGSLDDEDCLESQNLQWAQGKAGEDRVHVVVSEEHGWVFVGIYDGFNGPDAPDFLLSNLYNAVHREVKGLLWDDKVEVGKFVCENGSSGDGNNEGLERNCGSGECAAGAVDSENYPCVSGDFGFDSSLRRKRGGRGKYKGVAKKWEENQRRWKCEFDRERMELDRRLKEQLNKSGSNGKTINHGDVLKALSQALKKTEESYLDIADKMLMENPELALMGSCVLVMLMKGEDVYVMNVGDSRAVLAQKAEPDYGLGKVRQDLERINEETLHDLEAFDGERSNTFPSLTACQLTVDHSTGVEEEVERIRNEHPDDAGAVMNDRVKGSLKVTRAFGAGFLKQPKWNDALLEMFRIDYVGRSPYINCLPSLHHHRLGPKDKFLILCSDGLYQYLTNEEAVNEVELFIALQPEGDPAQHLVEEALFRAAKKAGMDFHELLEIPQGDRRRYHDDISIIVISLEGRIWRSCV